MADEKPSLDIFGIKPVADSVNILAKGAVDGAAAFLGRICLPAAEEFGLLFRDRVHHWRALNLAAISASAERKLQKYAGGTAVNAHPRMVAAVVEHGSWTDDAAVQDMWAGLLASSCTPDGDDDSNLVFVGALSQLTRMQAQVLRYACENSEKVVDRTGLVHSPSTEMAVPLVKLQELTGERDIYRLDRELDHLRTIGLLRMGFLEGQETTDVDLAPTSFALQLFIRCEGSRLSPLEFFNLGLPPAAEDEAS